MFRGMHLLMVLLFQAAPAHARWLLKAEAPSVVEKFETVIQVNREGGYRQETLQVVRVQSEDAKTSAGLVTIEYNAATDKVEILDAHTLNGKEKIAVEKSAIEDRDKGEAKDYDAIKLRSVVFPQVQIGSRVVIRYRVNSEKPVLKGRWSDSLEFFPGTWVEKFSLQIVSERPLHADLSDPRGLLRLKRTGDSRLLLTNRREFPGWVHGEKDPYFHPDSATRFWVATESDWGRFMAQVDDDYEKVLAGGVPLPLQPWLKGARKMKSAEERALFLMAKMSESFRYFGDWRRHDGGIVPRPLVEIERSRYGDCKDLSALLTALLRALDADAGVALVRRGENPYGVEPDYKIPGVGRFNHAIVRLRTPEGETHWLDPTNPVASLKPASDIAGRPAWVLDSKASRFERLPEIKPEAMEHSFAYEYRFRPEDVVAVSVRALFKDLAPFQIANQLMMAPRSEVLTGSLEYFTEDQEVLSFKYKKEPATGRVLKDMEIVLDYEAGRVTYSSGKGSFFVIPDGFLNGAFYETQSRESDLKLGEEPFVFRGTRRLKSTRLAQDPPGPCRVDSAWMALERDVISEGQDVVIRQLIELKRPYIRKAEFQSPAFRRLQQDTKRCFHRTGILIEAAKGALSMLSR